MKEPRGSRLIRRFHRGCSWKSNALPPHVSDPSIVRLQVHLKDDSLLTSYSNFAVLSLSFWVLQDAIQANTSFGISRAQTELERDHTCDTTGEQHYRRNGSD